MFSAANGEQSAHCFAKNERKQGWGFVFGTQLMLLSCAISHRVIAALGRNFIKLPSKKEEITGRTGCGADNAARVVFHRRWSVGKVNVLLPFST